MLNLQVFGESKPYYLANFQTKMKQKQPKIPQEDLFRVRLENMQDMNHELIRLSKHIDW